MTSPISKTPSYTFANWQRARDGVAAQETIEAILFTDAWVTGEVTGFGPYSFLNTIAHVNPNRVLRPAVVMRVTHHFVPTDPPCPTPMEDDFDHYHGGDYLDEMAALVSLFMGKRIKAGGVNRQFRADGDPFGRPVQFGGKLDPQLLIEGGLQIPWLSRAANLNESLEALRNFPDRTIEQTNAFIKAARQYQQAIWIADSDPSLAWLMLVSAVETVAAEWASKTTPIEQLKLALPQIIKIISESGCPELLEPVAKSLSRLTRATKRFVSFIGTFAPQPPASRPHLHMQVSYERAHLEAAMALVYNHRSRSLHEGTAFPLPMCEPPQYTKESDSPLYVQEKPQGLAMYSKGASWKVEQTPMLLNSFEHIARGALLNWWNSLGDP